MVSLGELTVRFKAVGAKEATKKLSGFQEVWDKLQKMVPDSLKRMAGGFAKFGVIATGVFAALTTASPRLRVQFEILHSRVNRLVRVFGDALAPIIEHVTSIVETATSIWSDLPEPMKQAILFGVQVVAVLGLIAAASIAVQLANLPLIAGILGLVLALAALHLIWTQNLGGIQETVERIFGNITNVIQGFIDFFKAIFAGDLEGAWDAIVGIFESGVELAIDLVTAIPKAFLGLVDFLTGGFASDLLKAGVDLFGAFMQGIHDTIVDIPLLGDLLKAVMDFLGGSLPEKGPLVKVPEAGRELGLAYVENIGIGLQAGLGGTFIRNSFQIDKVDLTIPSGPGDRDNTLDRFGSDVREATSW